MADPARRRLTAEEFVELEYDTSRPDPELMDGEIVPRASPRARHSRGQLRVARAIGSLDGPDDADTGWWLLIEPDWRVHLHTLLRPDLAGWRRERLPELPEGVLDLPPDWVCELVSPGHEAHDLQRKAAIYLAHEVPWYWVAFPEGGVLQVLKNAGATWTVHATLARGQKARVPPFEEIELDLDDLFLPPPKTR